MIVIKGSKEDFIWGDSYNGVLQKRSEIRLNSKYKEKWEFIAKEQRGGQWMENDSEEVSGEGGILANWQDTFWRQVSVIRHHVGMAEDKEPGLVSRVIDPEDEGFWLKCLLRTLAKTGQGRGEKARPKFEDAVENILPGAS